MLNGKDFETISDHSEFIKLRERVETLIITKENKS